MSPLHTYRQARREFLERLGIAVAGLGTGGVRVAESRPPLPASPWDMSWVERLKAATYRVVIDANERAGLMPGAILVPSGIFALIRAQNAGCARLRSG